jgi:hypothetical protein
VARVFISSTTEDLKEHRHAVVDSLRRLGDDPIVLENLSADGHKAPFDQSRSLIDSCQLFIGILAWRYGFIPDRDNPDQRSFVELEHRYAWETGRPTLVFMTSDDSAWPQRFVDRGPQAELQNQFRREVLGRVTVGYFTSPEDLVQKVVTAVSTWRAKAVSQARSEGTATASTLSLPPDVDPFELAWRLVVDLRADPSMLRHMDLDQLKEAVDKWASEGGAADLTPSRRYQAAQEQLRMKQTHLAPHALWLAWMRATRASLKPNSEAKPTSEARPQHA